MKKYAWITDSTAGLSKEFIEEHQIHIVPLSVIINGISYKEDLEITTEQVYQKLKDPDTDATTSQPSYGDFIELYKRLKKEYDYGIAIHASSQLTGAYQSSISAAREVGFPVKVIDSKIGNYALKKIIQQGIERQEEGASYEEVAEYVESLTNKTEMYLLPSSLSQLKRSGRVSTTQAIFASLLSINLLLRFQDGKVIVEDKIRTKSRAKNRLFSIIDKAVNKHDLQEICLMYAGVKDKAQTWKEELEKLHKHLKIKTEALVPVAGVHTGYGTMAVSWLTL